MENQYRYYLDDEVDNIHWVLTKNFLGNADSDLVMKFYTFLANLNTHFKEINVRYVGNETSEKTGEDRVAESSTIGVSGSSSSKGGGGKGASTTKGLMGKLNHFWPRTARSSKMLNAKLSNSITIDSDPQLSESDDESHEITIDYKEAFRKQCFVKLLREDLEDLRKKHMQRERYPKNYLELIPSSSSAASSDDAASASDSDISASIRKKKQTRSFPLRFSASKSSSRQIVTSDSASTSSSSRSRSYSRSKSYSSRSSSSDVSSTSSSENSSDAISNLENVEFKKRTVGERQENERERKQTRKKPKKKTKLKKTKNRLNGLVPNLARKRVLSESDDTESFYDSEVEKLSANEIYQDDDMITTTTTTAAAVEPLTNAITEDNEDEEDDGSDCSEPLPSLENSPTKTKNKRTVNGNDDAAVDVQSNACDLDENQNQNKRKRLGSSSGSDTNTDTNGDKENKQSVSNGPETAASWRNDPLARLRLDEKEKEKQTRSNSDGKSGTVDGEVRKKRLAKRQRVVSSDSDSDSDYNGEPLNKRRERIYDDTSSEEESSEDSTCNELPNRPKTVTCNGKAGGGGGGGGGVGGGGGGGSMNVNRLLNVAAASGAGGGDSSEHASRRNIRKIIKDRDLQRSTKLMIDAEKRRIERLKTKRKQLQNCLKSYDLQKRKAILACDSKTNLPLVQIDKKFMETLKEHQVEGIRFMWESCFDDLEMCSIENGRENNDGDDDDNDDNDGKKSSATGSGCILAHYMGLGKTFQVVALVHALFAQKSTNVKHVVVVCPVTTLHSWHTEFLTKFNNAHRKIVPHIYKLIGRNAVGHIKSWWHHNGVMLVSYEMLSSLFSRTSKTDESSSLELKQAYEEYLMRTDLIVCDEGHYIKNIKNLRSQALLKVRTRRRILLSGTPIQNNLAEYFWMVNFVKPNYLGSFTEFTNRFMNPIKNGQYENSTKHDIHLMKKRSYVLHEMLKETVQRMNSDVLWKYLPPKFDNVLYIQMSPLQRMLYNKFIDIVESKLQLTDNFVLQKNAFFFNHQIMRLIWTHPYCLVLRSQETDTKNLLVENASDLLTKTMVSKQEEIIKLLLKDVNAEDLVQLKNGTKMKILMQIIKEAVNLKEKTIIFSSSRLELTCIEYFLEKSLYKYNMDYIRVDGRNTITDRQRQFQEFCNSSANSRLKILVCSKKVGGVGLTLLPANRVVLMDVEWNPADDQQAVYRIYRFGQNKPAFVYRLVPNNTMEQIIYERSITKMAVSHRVIDEHQISRHFNSADLENVYRRVPNATITAPAIRINTVDPVLKKITSNTNDSIVQLKDHRSLLENVPDEELNDEERRIAWEEYESSIQTQPQPQPQPQPQLQIQPQVQPNVVPSDY